MGNVGTNHIYNFLYMDSSAYGILVDENVKHKKSVYKTIHYGDIKEVVVPPTLKEIKPENRKRFGNFEKYVNTFITKMQQDNSEDCLENLYNNIKTLKIKLKRTGLVINEYSDYILRKNIVRIHTEDHIYHELMHMSSTIAGTNKTGFCHNGVGIGLDEGYTELLTARLFNEGKVSYYYLLSEIVEMLENVVGPEMKKLYFKANLLGLINELKKYSSEDEIANFIYNTDILYNITCNTRDLTINNRKDQLTKSAYYIINIYNYLIKIYYLKLKEDLVNKKITEVEFETLQSNFLQKIRNYYINHFDCNVDDWYRTTTYKSYEEMRRK